MKFVIKVTHLGHELTTLDPGWLRFEAKTAAKRYIDAFSLYIGDICVRVGLSGKHVSRRNQGWLPEYLYVRIESAK